MGTEAGRRFLEAAPIPVGFEPEQRMPNAVARVLWPLQIGVVLVLLGVGLLFLRACRSGHEYSDAGNGHGGADARNWIYSVRRDYLGAGGASGADSREPVSSEREPTTAGQAVSRRGSGFGQEAYDPNAWESALPNLLAGNADLRASRAACPMDDEAFAGFLRAFGAVAVGVPGADIRRPGSGRGPDAGELCAFSLRSAAAIALAEGEVAVPALPVPDCDQPAARSLAASAHRVDRRDSREFFALEQRLPRRPTRR